MAANLSTPIRPSSLQSQQAKYRVVRTAMNTSVKRHAEEEDGDEMMNQVFPEVTPWFVQQEQRQERLGVEREPDEIIEPKSRLEALDWPSCPEVCRRPAAPLFLLINVQPIHTAAGIPKGLPASTLESR